MERNLTFLVRTSKHLNESELKNGPWQAKRDDSVVKYTGCPYNPPA